MTDISELYKACASVAIPGNYPDAQANIDTIPKEHSERDMTTTTSWPAEEAYQVQEDSSLNEEHIRNVRHAFDLFDRDRDGRITKTELINTIQTCGMAPNEEWVQELIHEADRDGSGTINWEEFLEAMTRGAISSRTSSSYISTASCRHIGSSQNHESACYMVTSPIMIIDERQLTEERATSKLRDQLAGKDVEVHTLRRKIAELEDSYSALKAHTTEMERHRPTINGIQHESYLTSVHHSVSATGQEVIMNGHRDDVFRRLKILEMENEQLKNYLRKHTDKTDDSSTSVMEALQKVVSRLQNQLQHYKNLVGHSSYGLTDEEIERYRYAFSLFDKDGDGHIRRHELIQAIQDCGFRPTDDWVKELIEGADRDGSGTIQWPDFLKAMTGRLESSRRSSIASGTEATTKHVDRSVVSLSEQIFQQQEEIERLQQELMRAQSAAAQRPVTSVTLRSVEQSKLHPDTAHDISAIYSEVENVIRAKSETEATLRQLYSLLQKQHSVWEEQVEKISRVNERLESQLIHYKTIYAHSIYGLTDEEIAKYRKAFHLFDQDRDGCISREEMATAIRTCGFQPTDKWVQELILEADRDGSGTIEWPEFLKAMTGYTEEQRVEKTPASMVTTLRAELSRERSSVATLKSKIERYEDEIERLRRDIHEIQESSSSELRIREVRMSEMQRSMDDALGHSEGEISTVRYQLENLRREKFQSDARYEELIREHEMLRRDFDQLKLQYNRTVDEKREMDIELVHLSTERENDNKINLAELVKLRGQVESYERLKLDYEQRLRAVEVEKQDLEKGSNMGLMELVNLRQQIELSEKSKLDHEKQLTILSKEREEREVIICEIREDLAQYRVKSEEWVNDRDELELRIRQLKDELNSSRVSIEELSDVRSRHDRLSKDNEDKDATILQLEKEKERLVGVVNDMQSQLDSRVSEVDQQVRHVTLLQSAHTSLRDTTAKEIDDLKDQLEEYQRQIAGYEQKLAVVSAESEDILKRRSEEVAALREKKEALIKEKQNTEIELRSLKQDHLAHQEEMALLKDKIKIYVTEADEYELHSSKILAENEAAAKASDEEIERLKHIIEGHEEEKHRYEKRLERMQTDTEQSIKRKADDIERLRHEVEILQAERDALSAQVQQMTDDIRHDSEKYSKSISELRDELLIVTRERDAFETKLAEISHDFRASEGRNEEKNQELQRLNEQMLHDIDCLKKDLINAIREREGEKEQYENQLITLRGELNRTIEREQQLTKETTILVTKHDDSLAYEGRKSADLLERINQLEKDEEEYKHSLKTLRDEHERSSSQYEDEIATLRLELDRLLHEKEEQDGMISDYVTRLKLKNNEIDELCHQLKCKEEDNQQREDKLDALIAEIESTQKHHRERIAELQAELDSADEDRNNLRLKYSQLSEKADLDAADNQSKLLELQKEVHDYSSKVELKEKEMMEVRSEYHTFSQHSGDSQGRMREELDACRKEKDEQKNHYVLLIQELEGYLKDRDDEIVSRKRQSEDKQHRIDEVADELRVTIARARTDNERDISEMEKHKSEVSRLIILVQEHETKEKKGEDHVLHLRNEINELQTANEDYQNRISVLATEVESVIQKHADEISVLKGEHYREITAQQQRSKDLLIIVEEHKDNLEKMGEEMAKLRGDIDSFAKENTELQDRISQMLEERSVMITTHEDSMGRLKSDHEYHLRIETDEKERLSRLISDYEDRQRKLEDDISNLKAEIKQRNDALRSEDVRITQMIEQHNVVVQEHVQSANAAKDGLDRMLSEHASENRRLTEIIHTHEINEREMSEQLEHLRKDLADATDKVHEYSVKVTEIVADNELRQKELIENHGASILKLEDLLAEKDREKAELSALVDTYESQQKDLHQKIDHLQSTIHDLETQNRDQVTRITELAEHYELSVAKSKEEQETLLGNVKSKVDETESERQRLLVVIREHEDQQKKYDVRIRNLTEEVDSLRSKIKHHEDHITSLNKEHELALKTTHEEHQSIIVTIRQQQMAKDDEIARLLTIISEKDQELNSVSSDRTRLRDEINELSAQIHDFEARIARLTAEYDAAVGKHELDHDAQIATLEQVLKDREDEKSRLIIRLDQQSDHQKNLESKIAALEKDLNDARDTTNSDIRTKDNELQMIRAEFSVARGQWEEERTQLISTVDDKDAKLQESIENMNAAEGRHREIEHFLADLRSEGDQQSHVHQRELTALRDQLDTVYREKEEYVIQVTNVQTSNTEIAERAATLTSSLRADLDSLTTRENQLMERIDVLVSEKATMEKEKHAYQLQIEQLSNTIEQQGQKHDDQLEDWRNRIQAVYDDKAGLVNRLSETEHKLMDQESEWKDLLDRLNEQIKTKEDEINHLKHDIAHSTDASKSQADEFELRIRELSTLLSANEDEAKQLKSQLSNVSDSSKAQESEQNQRIFEVEIELSDRKEEIEKLRNRLRETENTSSAQITEWESRFVDLNQQLASKEAEYDKLTVQVHHSTEATAAHDSEWGDRLDRLETQLSEREWEIEHLRKQLQESKDAAGAQDHTWELRISELNHKISDRNAEIEAHKRDLNNAHDTVTSKELELSDLASRLESQIMSVSLVEKQAIHYKRLYARTLYGLTEADIDKYWHAFELFDKNKDGSISKDELHQVIIECGLQPNAKWVQDLIHEADRDGSDSIEWPEFLRAVTGQYEQTEKHEDNTTIELRKSLTDSETVIEILERQLQEQRDKIDSMSSEISVMQSQSNVQMSEQSEMERRGDIDRLERQVTQYRTLYAQSANFQKNSLKRVILAEKYDGLTEEEIRKYSRVFDAYDQNGDGSIAKDEITNVLTECGLPPTAGWVHDLIAESDQNESGTIEWPEFLTAVTGQYPPAHRIIQINQHASGSPEDIRIMQEKDSEITRLQILISTKDHALDDLKREVTELREQQQSSPGPEAGPSRETVEALEMQVAHYRQLYAQSFHGISEEELNRYWKAFNIFDKNGDGSISKDELTNVIHELGLQPTAGWVQDLWLEADRDASGMIEWPEFLRAVTGHHVHRRRHTEYRTSSSEESVVVREKEEAIRRLEEAIGSKDDEIQSLKVEIDRLRSYGAGDEARQMQYTTGTLVSSSPIEEETLALRSKLDAALSEKVDLEIRFSETESQILSKESDWRSQLEEADERNRQIQRQVVRLKSLYAQSAYKLTDAEIERYHDAFRLFDENNDGMITVKELEKAIIKCGLRPDAAWIQDLIQEADDDGSGTIEWPEFLSAMNRASGGTVRTETVRSVSTVEATSSSTVLTQQLEEAQHKNIALEQELLSKDEELQKLNDELRVREATSGAASTPRGESIKEYETTIKRQNKKLIGRDRDIDKLKLRIKELEESSPEFSPTQEIVELRAKLETVTRERSSLESRLHHLEFKGSSDHQAHLQQLATRNSRLEVQLHELKETFAESLFGLSKEEIERYRQAFNLFDKDGDGCITKAELEDAIKACGLQPNAGWVQDLIREADNDGSGTIEWPEFLKAMTNAESQKKVTKSSVRVNSIVQEKEQTIFILKEELAAKQEIIRSLKGEAVTTCPNCHAAVLKDNL